jgi:hypothetical protein
MAQQQESGGRPAKTTDDSHPVATRRARVLSGGINMPREGGKKDKGEKKVLRKPEKTAKERRQQKREKKQDRKHGGGYA